MHVLWLQQQKNVIRHQDAVLTHEIMVSKVEPWCQPRMCAPCELLASCWSMSRFQFPVAPEVLSATSDRSTSVDCASVTRDCGAPIPSPLLHTVDTHPFTCGPTSEQAVSPKAGVAHTPLRERMAIMASEWRAIEPVALAAIGRTSVIVNRCNDGAECQAGARHTYTHVQTGTHKCKLL